MSCRSLVRALIRAAPAARRPLCTQRASVDEMAAALASNPEVMAEVLECVDTETRTAIVAVYFQTFDQAEMFDALDANKDGVVSQTEFFSWHGRVASGASSMVSSGAEAVGAVTSSQLRSVALMSAIPMVAFGFADNLIMVLAGDAIDRTLGIALGMSALAAAGLGNALSDVAGVFLSGRIETISGGLIEKPRLTRAQAQSSLVTRTMAGSSAFGIAFGCILGMFPLLFINSQNNENTKSLKQVFDLADRDGNAALEFEELTHVLSALGISIKPAAARRIFDEADVDGNGTISFSEFAHAARGFLSSVDVDNNGCVSAEETAAAVALRLHAAASVAASTSKKSTQTAPSTK